MKSRRQDTNKPEQIETDDGALLGHSEQTFRYAKDLRLMMDSHEKLQADYQRLQSNKERLLDRDEAFKRLLQDNRNLYVSTDRWGRIMHANPAAVSFLNMAMPRGESILRLLPDGLIKTGKSLQMEIDESRMNAPVMLKDASGANHEFMLRVIHGSSEWADKTVTHWLFFPQGEDGIDLSWTLATTVFNGAGEGILVTDSNAIVLTVNPAFCAMTGFLAREVAGQSPDQVIVNSDDAGCFTELLSTLGESEQWQGKIYLRHKQGGVIPAWLALSVSRHGDGQMHSCIGLVSDIAPLLKFERSLEFAANYDALTNLPNRSLFLNRLDSALALAKRQGEHISVLFIDLDGFKAANDRHGHDFGDFVLQEVARRLSDLVRESDTVARYGGDEFVMILQGMQLLADVEVLAANMIETTRRSIRFQGKEARIGFSVGCAQYPRHADNSASLVQMADAAMYLAKSGGGNRLQIFEAFENPARAGQVKSCVIQTALDNDLLTLVYQPQFDITLTPPRLIGVEALLRCQGSSAGPLQTPEMLLQSAARDRMTGRLSKWVLETGCRQLKLWHEQGLDHLRMSINLTSMQLRDVNFAHMVHEALDAMHIRQGSVWFDAPLDFDVNGFDGLYQVEGGREQLKLLRRLGVRLVMEDTLNQRVTLRGLSEMPFSKLKVGPETVAGLGRGGQADVQCKAVAVLARAFGLEVGAVGIETPEQLTALNAFGFDFGQGFLLGQPMSADDFWRWLKAGGAASDG